MAEIVLVTGATGALGPTVVRYLLTKGYQVRAFCRRTPQLGLLPAAVELVYGDITDSVAVDTAARGCHFIVHMAALLHIMNPSSTLHREYEAINVSGTANVLQAAQASGIRRVVYVSTIAVYGHGRPEVITEMTPPCPDSIYGETKLAAEQLVQKAKRRDGEPLGVILRLAAVYGVGIKGNYARLYQALERGRFVSLGRGTNHRTLVHEHDVAKATLLALAHPRAAGQIYNVTDGESHPVSTIVAAISRALQKKPPRIFLPVTPVRWAVRGMELLCALLRQTPPVNQFMIDKYLEEVMVSGSRFQNDLGFQPKYKLEKGWQQVAAARHNVDSAANAT